MPSKSELALKWPVFKPRNWGKPSPSRALPGPWFGLDTERDAKTGEFVCGWVVGETIARFQKLTDLTRGTYWVWNLAYDIEGMLRDLGIEEAWAARKDGAKFRLLDGEARYFHGKRFDYTRDGARSVSFIEASSFFGRCPLSKIGAKYGQKEGVKASEMSLSRYNYDAAYRRKVDSYCQQDSRIVYNAVQDLNMGVRSLGVDLGATPGATARRFLARLGQFPDILWETHLPFLRSYCGGRFEVVKRGILHDVYQYDLVSAYPWALAQCPWLTDGAKQRWGHRFSDNALYGTYCVSFEYPDYLGVAPRWKDGVRIYSAAQEKTWLARPEVAWLMKKGAKVKIHRALEVFDENATDLWRQVIEELFELKKRTNGTAESMGAKIVLNSQYGVLIQLVRRSGEWVPILEAVDPVDFAGKLALEASPEEFEGGKYCAPLYAGNLTSLTRVRLLDAAQAMGPDHYIGGHTDSVLGTRKLPAQFCNVNLGGWKLEKKAEVAQIRGTGMYAMDQEVKVRGITRKGTPELLWQEEHTRNSRCGIKSASSWDQVSLIRPKTVANNFRVEHKRHWLGDLTPQTIAREEYVDSEALVYV